MNNEYPPRPTEMCEPVYIGTSNIGKRVSTKKYKQSWNVFFGYYRFGRIKRMRSRRGIKNIRITRKKCKKIRYILHRPITRWNRH